MDWDALRPTCESCGEKSGQLGPGALCPTCRGDVAQTTAPTNVTSVGEGVYVTLPTDDLDARFTGDQTPLARELAKPTPQRTGRPRTFDHDEAMRRYAAGDPVARIASDLNAQPGTLHSLAKRRGIRHGQDAPRTPQAVEAAPSSPREVEPTREAPRSAVPTNQQELDAQINHATRVLRDTYDLASPAARLLRLNALSAIEALHLFTAMYPETPAPAAVRTAGAGQTTEHGTDVLGGQPEGGAEGEAARPPATPRRVMGDWTGTGGRKGRGPSSHTNIAGILEHYNAGKSIPEVAELVGHAKGTVRRILIAQGVQLRDDRKGHSGSKPKVYPGDFVEAVRRLYLEDLLTIDQVAERLGSTHKIVATVMRRHDIPRRPDAFAPSSPRRDNSVALKARMVELGLTSRQVKDWAVDRGLIDGIHVGLPSARLVDAYVEAHGVEQAS